MLQNARELRKYALRARDGLIGKVTDVYFDDEQWNVRYLVVDTGSWLNRRSVLISPEACDKSSWDERAEEHVLPVRLTKEQVRGSPGIDTDKPVSRQHEIELSNHYGWPVYWSSAYGAGLPATDLPLMDVPRPVGHPAGSQTAESARGVAAPEARGDPHLRSSSEVIGYHIEAVDGEIGHVEDLLIDDRVWAVRYFVIDTRNWWPGRKVILAPEWIRNVNWSTARVVVDLSRDTIRGSPEYDPAHAVTVDYAGQLHDYYGRPRHSPSPE